MNDKKKGKLQVTVIVLMILILVAAFVLIFLGHYSMAFVLFGIFIVSINFISNWIGIKNADYVYRKIHKNNDKW
ncbi:hypothetical protein [Lysinibacillus sphaericus]|uniref:Uncharacterized protein n=1 Tax=Lysinibacillus sphaericus OT4b.31 TaxID=1285586 RepID=R7ZHH4_LYSSH|nr:hypothetical protein [Lysinibacillus sphaericus]EON73494.1 hypothetical protein H131_05873 [Lysinibacillus sphaericus OT4b.31]